MLRRGERAVVVGAIVALALAALAGTLSAPARGIDDPRLSTYLTGPNGAKGLAQALGRLHLVVERRRRPYFDLASDRGGASVLLAFLDIAEPTARERMVIRDYVSRGGRIFVAGATGIESCFGYFSRRLRRGTEGDSALVSFPAVRGLPNTRRLLSRLPAESLAAMDKEGMEDDDCLPLGAARVDTLLRTVNHGPVALRLRFASGGEAILLADGRFLTNRSLKDTDAGLAVLPWFLDGRTRRVTVDEYHLGFGEGGSLPGASWAWLVSHPLGWAILQLMAVALVALGAQAVRFGPARHVIERRRRSPLEHLEALAAGLEGADGFDPAVQLLVTGLRRRLSRSGPVSPGGEREWLDALELAMPTPRGRAAAQRLQDLAGARGGGNAARVLAAAQSVEDVWEELRPRTTRDRF
jgi:hypothetical protein